MADLKKTKDVKIWIPEDLELDLRRLAELDDRRFGEYLGLILKRHAWGHAASSGADGDESNRGE